MAARDFRVAQPKTIAGIAADADHTFGQFVLFAFVGAFNDDQTRHIATW
jgi:hypothetical protein